MTINDLRDLYLTYREVSGRLVGFSKRWDDVVPVSSGELTKNWRPWHSPNGPAGSWFGECPLNDGEPLPPKWTCVVYVLFDHENVPCYVGSTNQFRQRVKRHAYDGKRFVRWVAYPCADREAAFDLEVKLLAEHKPYLNVKAGR